tara:strand:+ start:460 stop:1386 length:927 start_codon:yes stop_codon:yes gene_type:complete
MIGILYGLIPFIFITFLGFTFGKLKILDLKHAKNLNLFLYYIAVPALIIQLIVQNEIELVDYKQTLSYLIMQSICGVITYLVIFKYFKRPIPESIIWALTVTLSNHVTLLLPITEIFFQKDVITQVATIILIDSVILLSIVTFLLEFSIKKNIKVFFFIKNLFLNPIILSILVGIFFLMLNFNIDKSPIDYTLSKLAACVSPVGLFAIGIILSFYSQNIINKFSVLISFIKLIISPIILLLIGLIIFNLRLPAEIPGAFFVSVAPCGVTSIVLCAAYNVSPENIIKAIFLSTVLSIGTIFFAIKYLTL